MNNAGHCLFFNKGRVWPLASHSHIELKSSSTNLAQTFLKYLPLVETKKGKFCQNGNY